MKNLEEELKKYSEIYKLNFNSFKIIKKKTLFREKKIIDGAEVCGWCWLELLKIS